MSDKDEIKTLLSSIAGDKYNMEFTESNTLPNVSDNVLEPVKIKMTPSAAQLKGKNLKEVKQSYIDLIQNTSDELSVELNNEDVNSENDFVDYIMKNGK